ncbi:hypothetical protein bpmyx0001_26820 [Bacillus pseudomycoides DSM 12442]|nr:hypothetical protein bpmyx0001_26820 [Bacillus pseudomycoides DSM 12442]
MDKFTIEEKLKAIKRYLMRYELCSSEINMIIWCLCCP